MQRRIIKTIFDFSIELAIITINRPNRIQEKSKRSILACSAPEQVYREMLGVDQKKVVSVFLKGDYGVLSDRMDNRTGHYMNPNLLKSQLNTLEMPIDGITVNTDQSPEEIVNEIIKLLKAI